MSCNLFEQNGRGFVAGILRSQVARKGSGQGCRMEDNRPLPRVGYLLVEHNERGKLPIHFFDNVALDYHGGKRYLNLADLSGAKCIKAGSGAGCRLDYSHYARSIPKDI